MLESVKEVLIWKDIWWERKVNLFTNFGNCLAWDLQVSLSLPAWILSLHRDPSRHTLYMFALPKKRPPGKVGDCQLSSSSFAKGWLKGLQTYWGWRNIDFTKSKKYSSHIGWQVCIFCIFVSYNTIDYSTNLSTESLLTFWVSTPYLLCIHNLDLLLLYINLC